LGTFQLACDRREALRLELRDEDGGRIQFKFIEIHDIQSDAFEDEDTRSDEWLGPDGAPVDFEAEFEAEFEADLEAEIAEYLAEFASRLDGEEWKAETEPDPRWETVQYHCMVVLDEPAG
jgi:hypothetical protein